MDNEKENNLNLQKLGDRIRCLREEKKYSQETLGFKAGLHRNYISSLELAQKNPTYTTLIKLAKALDVSVVDLIHEENKNDFKD
ncbi:MULTISPECIES: helix-turn-helix domain-containing protein [Bacillus]|uniref:helix-turn-helix domain-containing protein n=1 Tax=Bacillus TaxID=1386 RepID=UPI0012B7ED2F|nr:MULTISPECIES: helix-turn-helix transcriptional regulator [Bacillus]MCY7844386.1 helix-turn-helix domain-containing protein [Bacillus haynesii]MCY8017754.1 helix-turn-helix domain-containing protein [Bacillus haynesii]MCY8404381.1 helix-turn-helix domain-containing protein [Bacillus sonorensis]MCY8585088.1 helix-turn-helix domain-containing protein [Bacillus haynesii]MCY8617111.1 helix-turn-helix domain-containing protein [Bacillus haynesii]